MRILARREFQSESHHPDTEQAKILSHVRNNEILNIKFANRTMLGI